MNSLLRCLLHVPVGIGAVILETWWPGMGKMLLLGFLVYEWIEDRWNHDRAYLDILGMLIGLPVGALVCEICRQVFGSADVIRLLVEAARQLVS